jgi:hypothetical protein
VSESDRPPTSDRRLLEHVLAGQRAQQISLSELHLLVAGYHAEAQRGNETMGVLIKHLADRCEDIEEEADELTRTTGERLTALDQSVSRKLTALDKRVDSTEKKLLVICTACTVVWTIGGVLWKVLG